MTKVKAGHLYIEKIDEVNTKIYCTAEVHNKLKQDFSFEMPGAKFTQAARFNNWDGTIFLYDYHGNDFGTIGTGLIDFVYEFAHDENLTISGYASKVTKVTEEVIKKFYDTLIVTRLDKTKTKVKFYMDLRPHQLEMVYIFLRYK